MKIGKARNGKPAFALMEKFEIPNFDTDENYLVRWRLIETPWFSIYLHRINTPDSRPTLHDHPWRFVAVMLRGGYVERRLNQMSREVDEHHVIKHVNYMEAGGAHSIMRLLRVPTWTLMFVGRRNRTWGYLEPIDYFGLAPEAWRWTEFDKHSHAYEFDAAMERRKEVK